MYVLFVRLDSISEIVSVMRLCRCSTLMVYKPTHAVLKTGHIRLLVTITSSKSSACVTNYCCTTHSHQDRQGSLE